MLLRFEGRLGHESTQHLRGDLEGGTLLPPAEELVLAQSRRVVLGSTTLIASGLYLFLAAGVGFLLREIHETRGAVVQAVFFVGAVAVLAIVLFSGTSG